MTVCFPPWWSERRSIDYCFFDLSSSARHPTRHGSIHVPACFHLFQGIFRSHQGDENCQPPLYSEVQEAFSFLMLDHSVAFQNLRLFLNISAPLTLLTLSSHDSSPPPLPFLLTVLHRGLPSSVRLTVSTAPYLFPWLLSHTCSLGILSQFQSSNYH